MSLIRVSAKDGQPCGVIQHSLLVDQLDCLENGKYLLSSRNSLHPGPANRNKDFQAAEGLLKLGAAEAFIERNGKGGYNVTIESPNIPDFIALRAEVMERLGFPTVKIDHPVEPVHPNEQSFVRGLANDLRRFRSFVAQKWNQTRSRIALAPGLKENVVHTLCVVSVLALIVTMGIVSRTPHISVEEIQSLWKAMAFEAGAFLLGITIHYVVPKKK